VNAEDQLPVRLTKGEADENSKNRAVEWVYMTEWKISTAINRKN
jgi:hypothetical protein